MSYLYKCRIVVNVAKLQWNLTWLSRLRWLCRHTGYASDLGPYWIEAWTGFAKVWFVVTVQIKKKKSDTGKKVRFWETFACSESSPGLTPETLRRKNSFHCLCSWSRSFGITHNIVTISLKPVILITVSHCSCSWDLKTTCVKKKTLL